MKLIRTVSTATLAIILSLMTGVLLAEDAADATALDNAYSTYQALIKEGSFSKALPHARRALEIGEALYGDDAVETATLTYNYGSLLLRLSRNEQSQKFLELALDRYEKLYGEQSPELVPALMNLGRAVAAQNNPHQAQRYLKRALKIEERESGGVGPDFSESLVKAGVILLNAGGAREAHRLLLRGYKQLREELGDDKPLTGYAAFQLGRYEIAAKNNKRAQKFFEAALATFASPDAPSNQLELTTHAFLVQVYEEMGDSEQATQHCLAIGRMTPFEPDQEQIPLYKRPPEYPRSALYNNQEGSVIIEFSVDENGFVKDPVVASSSGGKAFHGPALEAVKDFRYAPRFEDGVPVATTGIQNKISFKIAN